MNKVVGVFFCVLFFVVTACQQETIPKPKAFLRLKYEKPNYQKIESACPYIFEISKKTSIQIQQNCWAKIKYPKLNATLHLTYRNVKNNLNIVLQEVEKITLEHTIKADAINSIPFENKKENVYAMIYNVEGNAASNLQFRVTDSVKHVLAGALYFNVKPNYDSIQPAIKYIEKDVMHLIETLKWKK